MSLRKNTIWNLIGGILPLFAAAILIPYTLKSMGYEAFGVLTLIWALVGYFGLFDLGIGRSLTYEISKLKMSNQHSEIVLTLKAGLFLTFLTGILGAIFLWFLSPFFVSWLNISREFQIDAILAFKISALAIIPTTVTSGLRGALEGFERFAASNLSKIFIGFSMFALPALSIKLNGPSISTVAIYLLIMRIFVVLFVFWQLRLSFLQGNAKLNRKHFNKLFNYGFWVTVTGIVGPLMVYGDRFFVSAIVGATQLPLYAIPQEGLLRLFIVPTAFCAALLPKLSALKKIDAIALYNKSYKRVAMFMLVICILVASLAYPALYWWISPDFARRSILVVLIMIIGIYINSLSLVPITFLHSNGNPKITAIFHMIELIIYVPILWLMTNEFGLIGAAISWVFRVLVDYFLIQITICRLIDKPAI